MKKILKFILPPVLGLLISVVILGTAAIIICYAPLGKGSYDIAATCAKAIGAAVSGLFAAKGTASRGWLRGGTAGVLYILLLFAISLFKNPMSLLWAIPKAFVFGMIGGVIGINI